MDDLRNVSVPAAAAYFILSKNESDLFSGAFMGDSAVGDVSKTALLSDLAR